MRRNYFGVIWGTFIFAPLLLYGNDTNQASRLDNDRCIVAPTETIIYENHIILLSSRDKIAGDWSANILLHSEDESGYVWVEYLTEKNNYCFEVYAESGSVNWRKAVITNDEVSGHRYFHGMVTFKSKEVEDTIYVKYSLVPTRPIVKEVLFSFENFDYEWGIFENPLYTFTIRSEKANSLIFHESFPSESFEEDIFLTTEIIPQSIGNSTYQCSLFFEWNQEVVISAANEYGASMLSETIYLIDYINDLHIKEYLVNLTGIFDTPYYELHEYCILGNVVSFNDIVKELSIWTLDGKCVMRKSNIRCVDLGALEKGVYNIIVVDRNNNKHFKKIGL